MGHIFTARILEIGCFEGRATCWLLENFPKARITCVDITMQPTFWRNIEASHGKERVELQLGQSRDILLLLPRNAYDLIYVDGSHNTVEVLEDAILAFRLAKVGAIIGFDDYEWTKQPVKPNGTPKKAIDVFLDVYRHKITVRSKNYQVWVRKIAE